MDTLSVIEKAISYIEEHLEKPLSVHEIAFHCGYSVYYFQRLFSAVCKISVGEYIRRRKMTLAAYDLLNSNIRITDTAYKYGYETPESFTKAFNRYHGISPSELKKQGFSAKEFLRINPTVSRKDKLDLTVNLKHLQAFRLIGISAQFPLTESEFRDDIPDFWNLCQENNTIHTLFQFSSTQPFKGIAACCMEGETKSSINYMIGVCSDKMKNTSAVLNIPESDWLCVKGTGRLPQAIQQTWHQIYTDYFPASRLEQHGHYDLEIYPAYEMDTAAYTFEIWIPVKEREKE